MQTLLLAEKIHEEHKKEQILELVSSKYCLTILDAIKDEPKSAAEIAEEKKIPISTVYRRIQTLHDLGLLRVTGDINKDGKKFFLYQSKISTIRSKFSDGEIEVWLYHNKI